MNQYQVTKVEAAKFGQQWNHKGVAIMLDEVHHQYATDFANVVLQNFILLCQQQAAQRALPRVQLAEA